MVSLIYIDCCVLPWSCCWGNTNISFPCSVSQFSFYRAVTFFWETYTKIIHFLQGNSWWTYRERRNFGCWNRRNTEELAKSWECDNKPFNHRQIHWSLQSKYLSKRVWKQTCRWRSVGDLRKTGGFPFLSHVLWFLLPLPTLPLCAASVPLAFSRARTFIPRSGALLLDVRPVTNTGQRTLLPAAPSTSSILSCGTSCPQEAESKGKEQAVINRRVRGWSTTPNCIWRTIYAFICGVGSFFAVGCL